jgi:hypothetical protein
MNIDHLRPLIVSNIVFPGLNGCIRRFKLGHREIKIQATSEPFSLRRVGLSECRLAENEMSPNDVSPVELPSVEVSPCRCPFHKHFTRVNYGSIKRSYTREY